MDTPGTLPIPLSSTSLTPWGKELSIVDRGGTVIQKDSGAVYRCLRALQPVQGMDVDLGSARHPWCLVMFSTALLPLLATSTKTQLPSVCEASLSGPKCPVELLEPSALPNNSFFRGSQVQVSGEMSDFVFMSQAYRMVPPGLYSSP